MSTSDKKTLVFVISAIAGAAGGRWITPRVGTALGLTLKPWAVAAGGVVGAWVGATIGRRITG